MLITYDNLLRLPAEPLAGEHVELAACAYGKVMLTMSTSDFRVEHKDGKASVCLFRHLTNEQARELANVLLERVAFQEEQAREWNSTPEGSVVTVIGHGG